MGEVVVKTLPERVLLFMSTWRTNETACVYVVYKENHWYIIQIYRTTTSLYALKNGRDQIKAFREQSSNLITNSLPNIS